MSFPFSKRSQVTGKAASFPSPLQAGRHPSRAWDKLEGVAQLDVSDVVASQRFGDSWTRRCGPGGAGGRAPGEALLCRQRDERCHPPCCSQRSLVQEVVLPRGRTFRVRRSRIVSLRAYVTGSGCRLVPECASDLPLTRSLPLIKRLYLAPPSYYGIAQPLGALADRAHRRGGLLLVDEAHGAHFGFHPHLPRPALQCGADLVAQSTHKVLGAFTQSSMLHVGAARVPEHSVERALLCTASTSPSGLLLASLTPPVQVATDGPALGRRWNWPTTASPHRHYLGVRVLCLPICRRVTCWIGRLVIRTRRGLHGVEAARLMQFGAQVELADPWHVVALITGILGKRQTGCSRPCASVWSRRSGAGKSRPGRVEPAEAGSSAYAPRGCAFAGGVGAAARSCRPRQRRDDLPVPAGHSRALPG